MKGIGWLPSPERIELRKRGFLLDPAHGLCMPEGNTRSRVQWRATARVPESKIHSRYTLRLQGNQ